MPNPTVIYLGDFELPDKSAAAHRVLSNAKILRELGYRVVFLDVDKTLESVGDLENTHRDIQGFDCYAIPYPKTKKEWAHYLYNIDSFKIICEKYKNVKMVICYNYQSLAFINIIKYCKRKSIRVIADCTEWYSSKGRGIIFGIIKYLDTTVRMRLIHKHIDALIVISEYLATYYIKCKKIILLPPLVDLSEEKWLCPNPIPDNILRFIYAGNPGKYKDKLSTVIDALSIFVWHFDFELSIIGITREQFLNIYPEYSGKLDALHNNIVFYGSLSHREAINHIKDADFSIFFRESNLINNAGFPTKFVESISCGTPVITTRTSNIDKYLQDGFNGFFVDIDNKDEIVAVMKKIFALSKQDINEMKKNCYESKIFDIKKWTSKLRTVFLDV